eukprot:724199-Rhodomonas_salina.1
MDHPQLVRPHRVTPRPHTAEQRSPSASHCALRCPDPGRSQDGAPLIPLLRGLLFSFLQRGDQDRDFVAVVLELAFEAANPPHEERNTLLHHELVAEGVLTGVIDERAQLLFGRFLVPEDLTNLLADLCLLKESPHEGDC